ncbi:MAG: hypothetical protein HN742_19960 [Lentisphaerae bacterium]|jgi:hypothetical protein|nr:hypothetical protein [Lentisphaerota bacterium]MBT5607483.1 hypothetical protein [Lentisphaerota bacterium]MBT7060000.1 hypothetical protein [Lentisphaerota bacterium]MBT7844166.1 hypothetical protein [Lentisphaerota bacterium]
MRASLIASLFFPVLAFSQPQGVASTRMVIDLSSVSIPEAIPGTLALKHCPYSGNERLIPRDDVSPEALAREVSYTWHWLEKALRREFLPSRSSRWLVPIAKVKGSDDGIGGVFSTDRYRFEVLDTRVLTVLVHNQLRQPMSPLSLFREVVNYDRYVTRQRGVDTEIAEQTDLAKGVSFGRIRVTYVSATGGFSRPIEWLSSGNAVLFLFHKESIPAVSKSPPDPTMIVGGMPYSDGRPFLRFQGCNRMEMAREYFARMQEERREHAQGTESARDTSDTKHNPHGILNPDGTVRGGVFP